jgi:hypothetical protein
MTSSDDHDCDSAADEIVCSVEPEDDLPRTLLVAVVALVFKSDDLNYVVAAAEILKALNREAMVGAGQSVDDLIESAAGLSLIKSYRGKRIVTHEKWPSTVELKSDLSKLLNKEVFGVSREKRVQRTEALHELAYRWLELATDIEKLLGHLILRYGVAQIETADSDSFEKYFGILRTKLLENPVPPKPSAF